MNAPASAADFFDGSLVYALGSELRVVPFAHLDTEASGIHLLVDDPNVEASSPRVADTSTRADIP